MPSPAPSAVRVPSIAARTLGSTGVNGGGASVNEAANSSVKISPLVLHNGPEPSLSTHTRTQGRKGGTGTGGGREVGKGRRGWKEGEKSTGKRGLRGELEIVEKRIV